MKTSLLIGPEYRQVAIKTEKGVRQLRFIRSEKIERMDEKAMKAEQDAFQKAFAGELQRITE